MLEHVDANTDREPTEIASTRWSGDVETRRVTVEPLESTTDTATDTNGCGETSSVDVSVTVENGSARSVGATDPDGDGSCEDGNGSSRFPTSSSCSPAVSRSSRGVSGKR